MKKKILSVMLSAAMCAGLLAGCGGQGGSGETQGSAAGAGSQGQTADGGDAGEDNGEPVSVTVGVAQQFTTLDPGRP